MPEKKYSQVKVEESIHRRLKARAAKAGKALQEYVEEVLVAHLSKDKGVA